MRLPVVGGLQWFLVMKDSELGTYAVGDHS